MKILFLLSFTLLLVKDCGDKPTNNNITSLPKTEETTQPVAEESEEVATISEAEETLYKSLIFNTKLNINPAQPNWVLFSNGSHILFPTGTSEEDMRRNAVIILQRYNGGNLTITKSPLSKGWIAGSTKGVYNYVALDQANDRMAKDPELASIGKSNILKDKENSIIIHVNKK